jgi:glycosyltransferase involved in cell wall biosynthesis
MEMRQPKVSVIIPTYNREHLIQKSINSVLNQTYKNIELIVVDDCSTDNTEAKVNEIKDERLIFLKSSERKGPSVARNSGIKKATGELIAFQDSDDVWKADKLEKQVEKLFNSSPEVAAVYCGMEFFDVKSDEKLGEDLREIDFRKAYDEGLLYTPWTQTVLIKKSVLDEVGYFDERLSAAEDTELAIRVSKKYRYAFVKGPLLRVGKNHNSLMGNAKNYYFAWDIIINKHEDFLNKKILFKLCKVLANYYILKKDSTNAKKYIRKCLKYSFDPKTLFTYLGLIFTPFLIQKIYNKKYKNGIPHPVLQGQFLTDIDDNYIDY